MEKLGQEPAFPTVITELESCELITINDENNRDIQVPNNHYKTITYPGISKRFYAACAAKDDFDEFSRKLQEILVGRDAPDIDKSPLEFWEWYAEGRAKWKYIQADELLKQEEL